MNGKGNNLRVTGNSLLDLKAELLRKQEELKKQKLQVAAGQKIVKTSNKKPTIWSKQNTGVLQRAQADVIEHVEEVDEIERSRAALEAKTKIYDSLTSGNSIPDEDGCKEYLVDFELKAIERVSERRRAQIAGQTDAQTERQADRLEEGGVDSSSEDPLDEWVEYVDQFGRSRRCLRGDLAKMTGNTDSSGIKSVEGGLELLSEDMRRELRRQEWEKEVEQELNAPSGPVHYANIQRNEVRDHGVGFFQFSKDEEIRKQQMEELKKLRSETREERQRKKDILRERKAKLESKLVSISQHKDIKSGPASKDEDDVGNDPMALLEQLSEIEAADITTDEDQFVSPLVRDESWKKDAPEREWDKDKKPVLPGGTERNRVKKPVIHDEASWLEARRSERVAEFAPPTQFINQSRSSKPPPTNNKRIFSKNKASGSVLQNSGASASVFLSPGTSDSSFQGSDVSVPCASTVEESIASGLRSLREESQSQKSLVVSESGSQNHDQCTSQYDVTNNFVTPISHGENSSGGNTWDNVYSGGYMYTNISNISEQQSWDNTNMGHQQNYKGPGYAGIAANQQQISFRNSGYEEMNTDNSSHWQNFSRGPRYDYMNTDSTSDQQNLSNGPGYNYMNQASTMAYQQNFNCGSGYDYTTAGIITDHQQNYSRGPGYDIAATESNNHNSRTFESSTVHAAADVTTTFSHQVGRQPGANSATMTSDRQNSCSAVSSSVTSESDFLSTDDIDINVASNISDANQSINSNNSAVTQSIKRSAPQPSHYGSKPMPSQPKQPRYEAVYLHDVPQTLPAPPTVDSVPHYPSQEVIIGPGSHRSDSGAVKHWYKQFDGGRKSHIGNSAGRDEVRFEKVEDSKGRGKDKSGSSSQEVTTTDKNEILLKPRGIPFASPYIQNEGAGQKSEAELKAQQFDLSRPPPPVTKS